jgi:hypothetical protein
MIDVSELVGVSCPAAGSEPMINGSRGGHDRRLGTRGRAHRARRFRNADHRRHGRRVRSAAARAAVIARSVR